MPLEDIEKELYKQKPPLIKEARQSAPTQKEEAGESFKRDWELSRMKAYGAKKPFRQTFFGKFFLKFAGGIFQSFKKLGQYQRYGRWVFGGLIGAALILLAVSGFYLYGYFTAKDINFSVEAPKEAMLGAPFDLKIQIDNQSENAIRKVRLSISLPEDILAPAQDQTKQGLVTQELGDLDKAGSLQRKIPLVIFGKERNIKRFRVTLSYVPSGLEGRVEKAKVMEILAKEPAIKVDIITPQKVLNNEEFEILARYTNVSDVDFYKNAALKFTFPQNFVFKSSEPTLINKTYFAIEDLIKNAGGEISIRGKLIGEDDTFSEIKVETELSLLEQTYKIDEKTASVLISSSPLSLKIFVNDQGSNYVSSAGQTLKYSLAYRNNTEMGLQDVVIKARLVGEMFDFSSLETDGFFNSAQNLITWNAANTPELRRVAPGATGKVEFEIDVREDYPIKKKSDKNFTLKALGEITSPTVPYYVTSEQSIGLSSLENKVAGRTTIEPQVYFKEPNAEIVNKGSLPPRVNIPVNFTVHLIVKNYATDVRDVKITGFLQSSVKWTGVVKSNVASQPTYNERTSEIIWVIDKIPATKGVIDQPIEAIFQVEATPDITQLQKEMLLLDEIRLQAIDDFAGIKLESSAEKLTTRSLKDSDIETKDTRVSQ